MLVTLDLDLHGIEQAWIVVNVEKLLQHEDNDGAT